eukprot:m.54957 g.54957  ORF g.54957 m.54957 type:complete len:632 (-) comp9227_c0_seq1:80-1975(-)
MSGVSALDDARHGINAEEHTPLLSGTPAGHALPPSVSPIPDYATKQLSEEAANESPEDSGVKPRDPKPCCTRRRCCCCGLCLIVFAGLAAVGIFYVYPMLLKLDGNVPPAPAIPPGAPAEPVIASVGRSTVDLEWELPENEGTATIVMFQVQWRSHDDWPDVPQLNVTDVHVTATDLLGNVTYCFQVRAVSSAGFGNFSDPACNTTLLPTAPDLPTAVFPVGTSRTGFTAAIELGADNGDPISAVVVEYEEVAGGRSENVGASWEVGCLVEPPCGARGEPCTCTVSGLAVGKAYQVRCRTNNSIGDSEWTKPVKWHTDYTNAKVPAMPTHLSQKYSTSSAFTVKWTPPRVDGGAMVLGYRLQSALVNATHWITDSNSTSTEHAIEGLLGNTVYCVRVQAFNSAGLGPWSTPNNTVGGVNCFRTDSPKAPGIPVLLPLPLGASGTSITVGWTVPPANGRAITNYTLQRDDWWVDGPLSTVFEGDDTQFTADQSMLPATVYHFRVRASNAVGDSEWSDVANYSTDQAGHCGNPSDVAVYKRTKSSMKREIQTCLIKCALDPHQEDCVKNCIQTNVGLTQPCGSCWYEEGMCTLKHCAFPCKIPGSDKCTQCSEQNCFPACVACSGIPKEFFPP